ncbi:MAG: energy-coupling factor ABC transporter ATP-binding protein [Gemmobacter sp.]|jgi:biotin transport system ATP-binding protein|nr:energy-coupling factor ABC transporter ATP-binding protein [Gemmobacter sp.]
MDAGIELSGVEFVVQGKTILHGVSLSLTARRVGIIGRNGSGKTTLLRLIAGLVAPTSGTLRVAGRDPARERQAMLAEIGILFQNPEHQIIFPTVEEELTFGLHQMGRADEAAARVQAMLAAEGRAHWAGAPVSALSQGQKQWLCLMAVLLMAPRRLLLDEPFAALDLPTQARLRRRLADLPQQIITISHDPEAVADCDRVIWIEAGTVAMEGAPEAVLPAFRAEMTRLGEADADTDLPR